MVLLTLAFGVAAEVGSAAEHVQLELHAVVLSVHYAHADQNDRTDVRHVFLHYVLFRAAQSTDHTLESSCAASLSTCLWLPSSPQ